MPHNEQQQAALWNGSAGRAWVEGQELLDRIFRPFEDLLMETVAAESGGRVLDVGCGTGTTTLAAARKLGAGGHCTGIDISEPVIAAAQARAEREGITANFVQADAQTYAFEPASFDMIISRFGVMFFDDPVQAFANLRGAAAQAAPLRCIAYRSVAENPFMIASERAAAHLLPALGVRQDNVPGQFGFADPHRVRGILRESGWTGIDIQPLDVDCAIPEMELLRYAARLSPAGRAAQEADEETRAQVAEAVCAAFQPYVHGTEVRFTAACWMVRAG